MLSKSRVLETRTSANGLVRRKRLRDDGITRFDTIEIPMEVWTALNKTGRGNDRMAGWVRKMKSDAKRKQAIELFKTETNKVWWIADQVGAAERTVRHWLTDYKRTGKTSDAR